MERQLFVDLSGWRKVGVSGSDAIDWLDDLLTADLRDLGANRSKRALLLSPTGRIRADVTVAVPGGSVVLIQDPAQPDAIDRLLSPYVLSSDVEVRDRTDELCLFALPGRATPPDAPGTAFTAPSCLGPGVDLSAAAQDHDRLAGSLSKAFVRASDTQAEAWRVRSGIPRFGVDALPEDLPQEGGLVDAVAFGKGCYLGQEAVAKVQNLGHPRRVLLHLVSDGPLVAGDPLFRDGDRCGDGDGDGDRVDGREAGRVTSAATAADGSIVALARIRWDARESALSSSDGVSVRRAELG